MRILSRKRDNSLAKNFQQTLKIAALQRERGIQATANPSGRHMTIHAAIAETAKVISHKLDDGITPIAYFVGGGIKHFV
jgi:hypothetical protein